MKSSVLHLQNLYRALKSLDGRNVAAKDREGNEFLYFKAYDLNYETRLAISKNMTAIKDVLRAPEDAVDKTLKQYTSPEGEKPKPGDEKFTECQTAIAGILDSLQEVELIQFDVKKLNVDKNQIAGSVLSELDPVFIKEEK